MTALDRLLGTGEAGIGGRTRCSKTPAGDAEQVRLGQRHIAHPPRRTLIPLAAWAAWAALPTSV
jgi:hypothetical protein